jgi:hypothetical protein
MKKVFVILAVIGLATLWLGFYNEPKEEKVVEETVVERMMVYPTFPPEKPGEIKLTTDPAKLEEGRLIFISGPQAYKILEASAKTTEGDFTIVPQVIATYNHTKHSVHQQNGIVAEYYTNDLINGRPIHKDQSILHE